jgi:hypothetical protein
VLYTRKRSINVDPHRQSGFRAHVGSSRCPPRVGGQRTFAHPQVGFLVLEQVTLAVSNVPDIKVVVLMSTNDESTHKLTQLSVTE